MDNLTRNKIIATSLFWGLPVLLTLAFVYYPPAGMGLTLLIVLSALVIVTLDIWCR